MSPSEEASPDPGAVTPASLAAALTEPVAGNAGLRLYLQQDLEQRIAHSKIGPGDITLKRAEEALQARAREASGKRRALLIGAAFAVLSCIFVWQMIGLSSATLTWFRTPGGIFPWETEWQSDRLEALWIPGSPARPRDWEVTAANAIQWQIGESPSPALYLSAMKSAYPLPPSYEQTWRRIDPDNGVWLLLEAERALNASRGTLLAKQKAHRLVREAAKLPRCDSYTLERKRIMFSCFKPPQNFAEAAFSDGFIEGERLDGYSLAMWLRRNAQQHCSAGELVNGKEEYDVAQALALRALSSLSHSGDYGEDPSQWGLYQPPILRGSPLKEDLRREGQLQQLAVKVNASWPAKEIVGADDRWLMKEQGMFAGFESLGWLSLWEKARLCYVMRLVVAAEVALFSLIAAGLWLRQRRWKGAAAQCSYCLRPLQNAGRGARLWWQGIAAPLLWLTLMEGLNLTFGWNALEEQPVLFLAYPVVLFAVSLVMAARREVSHSLRLVGFAPDDRWKFLERALLIFVYLTPGLAAVLDDLLDDLSGNFFASKRTVFALFWLSLPLLWLGLKAFSGFSSLTATVRHSLLARRMLPGMWCVAALLILQLPVLNLMEFRLTRQAVEMATTPRMNPEAIREADALMAEWGRE